MNSSKTTILILVLVLVGSLFFLFQPNPPEKMVVVSEDGVARVEALVDSDVELILTHEITPSSEPVASQIYKLETSNINDGALVEIFIESELDPSSYVLAYWDVDEKEWTLQRTEYRSGEFVARGFDAEWALVSVR